MLKNKKTHKEKPPASKTKRILTLYSSNHSINEPLPKSTSITLKKTNNQPHLNSKHKDQRTKQKGRPSIMKNRVRTSQNYEKIPMHFVNSNTNSEIQFSNYEDNIKNNGRPYRKLLFIDCDDKALINEIWRVDKKKSIVQNKAAIKIQKVFRGYLTRKLLMKYVQQYEMKLLAERQKTMERKISHQTYSKQSFNLDDSNLKRNFFPSHKKSLQHEEDEDKYHLQMESSIMLNENDHLLSLQEPSIQMIERKGSYLEKSIFTENQESITQQQEISLSFGNQSQFSPHFTNYPLKRRKNQEAVILSPNKDHLKSYISEDKTRDAISQNISNCASYSKPFKGIKEESRHSSILKYDSIEQELQERQEVNFEKLRSTEKSKWQKVIQFVNGKMKEGLDQQKTKDVMSVILEFSVKNREQLNKNAKKQEGTIVTPTTVTQRQAQVQLANASTNQKVISFRKNLQGVVQQQNRYYKIDQNYAKKKKEKKEIFERTTNMKEFFLKTLNLQDHQIDKMIQLREAVLRRKQSNSLLQLNHKLQNNQLSQDDFLGRLNQLSARFQRQKKDIQQTKGQIYQGYRAQLELVKHTMLDAKFLGYNMPFSRSMEIFPNQSQWKFDSLMIDELNQLAIKRSSKQAYSPFNQQLRQQGLSTQKIEDILQSEQKHIDSIEEPSQKKGLNDKKDNSSDDNAESQQQQAYQQQFGGQVQSMEDQTHIYDVENPFSVDVSEYFEDNIAPYYKQNEEKETRFSKKLSDFKRGQSLDIHSQFEITDNEIGQQDMRTKGSEQVKQQLKLSRMPKKQTFTIQFSSSESQEEEMIYKEKDDKRIEDLSTHILTALYYQILEDIFCSKKIVFSFDLIKAKQQGPAKISRQEKLQFIRTTSLMLPPFQELKYRLNQKMYPNISEYLISMRENIEFEDQNSEVGYYEINRYEYVLNQNICFEAIQAYTQTYQSRKTNTKVRQLQNFLPFVSSKLKKYNGDYVKQMRKLEKQLQNQRVQALQIQLHLILDAWNEQLIKHRQNRHGYSGIGLGQISLSLINRYGKPLNTQAQWREMLALSISHLYNIITNDDNNEMLLQKENKEIVCENNSQWIYYTQEGFEIAFDIFQTIQAQLYLEVMNEFQEINGKDEFEEEIQSYYDGDSDSDGDSVSVSVSVVEGDENIQLNQVQLRQLQKKMLNMNLSKQNSDSDGSSFD